MNASARTFSLLDMAILVALAAGVVFAAASSDREFLSVRKGGITARSSGVSLITIPPNPVAGIVPFAHRVVHDVVAVLYVASPLLALIAYRPRRGIHPRRRGPGHVSLAIAGGVIALGLAGFVWRIFGPSVWTGYPPMTTEDGSTVFWYFLPLVYCPMLTYAILAGWITLAAIGGWRKPQAPLERTGRWLGVAWVLTSVAVWCLGFISE